MDPADHPKSPKGRSIAHNILTDESAVFLSLEIEIGGEYADSAAVSGDSTDEVGCRMRWCTGPS